MDVRRHRSYSLIWQIPISLQCPPALLDGVSDLCKAKCPHAKVKLLVCQPEKAQLQVAHLLCLIEPRAAV